MIESRKIGVACAIALIASLAGCGKKVSSPPEQTPQQREVQALHANINATFFGAVRDADWYLIISSPESAKPLVIWSGEKEVCIQDSSEFALKSVDMTSVTEPPRAWCLKGRELRARFGIS